MSLPGSAKVIAFVATRNRPAAKGFYVDRLGLSVVSEDPFALVLDAHGTMVRVTQIPTFLAASYTVLGWAVADIAHAVAGLREAGIVFERFPGLEQDEAGVWTPPGGAARVAWFKDLDGNVLSVSEHAGA